MGISSEIFSTLEDDDDNPYMSLKSSMCKVAYKEGVDVGLSPNDCCLSVGSLSWGTEIVRSTGVISGSVFLSEDFGV